MKIGRRCGAVFAAMTDEDLSKQIAELSFQRIRLFRYFLVKLIMKRGHDLSDCAVVSPASGTECWRVRRVCLSGREIVVAALAASRFDRDFDGIIH